MSVKKNLYFINLCVESQNKIHSNFSIDFDAYSEENSKTEFQVPKFWKASDKYECWRVAQYIGTRASDPASIWFHQLNTELA